jgi:NADP-dependent 3-hydroxy acid dehydrogenase YdfG
MSGIANKYFAVTGAASGIGQAELGAAGIAISDLDESGLAQTTELCTTFDSLLMALLI